MKGDLGKSFDKLLESTFVKHRGFTGIRYASGHIEFKGEMYGDTSAFIKAVDNYIREGGVKIGNSIRDVKDKS